MSWLVYLQVATFVRKFCRCDVGKCDEEKTGGEANRSPFYSSASADDN